MNVVDSSAWLAYFAGEESADFFSLPIEDVDLLLVPSVCVLEVFKGVLRERGEDAKFQAAAAMRLGQVVDLSFDLALEAASLGRKEGLALADSVVYATAQKHEAILWTQDEDFKGRPNVQFRAKQLI